MVCKHCSTQHKTKRVVACCCIAMMCVSGVCSYIISQGDVRCLGVLVELMMGVCDPTVLNGESGYYLTVLGAALSVIMQAYQPAKPRRA